MSEDVFSKLKEDHEKVKKLFSKLKKEDETSKRKELFEEIRTELLAHAEAEERVFYPLLKDEKKTRDLTLEAYVEHEGARDLIEKISKADPSTDEWMAMCRVLSEVVEHHVEEEEEDLFPKARKIFSTQQAVDLEGMIEQEEDSFKKSANF